MTLAINSEDQAMIGAGRFTTVKAQTIWLKTLLGVDSCQTIGTNFREIEMMILLRITEKSSLCQIGLTGYGHLMI